MMCAPNGDDVVALTTINALRVDSNSLCIEVLEQIEIAVLSICVVNPVADELLRADAKT